MYLFVKNNAQETTDVDRRDEKQHSQNYPMDVRSEKNEKISEIQRALGFLASMLAGLFYGTMWLPINYMKNHPEEFADAPTDCLSYVFSFYCGVLCTSIFIFAVYCLIKRNKPWMNPEAAVPSMLGGAIVAVGMAGFGVAIDRLDQAIAYPICAMAPGLVASLWSILYFREITDRQNLLRLTVAYALTLAGVALVTLSREVSVL
ncbi:hypothetical protein Y032_0011g1242 [Ancylostoma ceylanicum]|nr:hypothetical protein Y032_0011g1242 [Ancylostoma ceylanicum]